MGGNIKIDIQEVSWEGGDMDWFDLAQNRDGWRGSCKSGTEPSGSIIFREFLD